MNRRKQNLFQQVPIKVPSRNLFDLSHEVKMSGKFGYLYPVLLMDTLPGDTIRDQMTCFIRFAPMLAPILHLVDVTTHFFFVPNRILWDEWEDFITGGQDGTLEPVSPYVTPNSLFDENGEGYRSYSNNSLWDYLGLPVLFEDEATSGEQISALPFYAYMKVWNDYYRDPNLHGELTIPTELSGDVTTELWDQLFQRVDPGGGSSGLLQRGWERGYFESALPWAQRGATVLLPLSGVASAGDVNYLNQSLIKQSLGGGAPGLAGRVGHESAGGIQSEFEGAGVEDARIENIDSIDFTNVSTTVNDWRRTMAIQRWLENNARGGARYMEQIQSHFNVRVPDYRLQRSEYLGGGRQHVQISEVLATADSATVPVGDLAGHGISVGKSNRFTYPCQEHGWVIGILSVMPKPAYSQGIERMWSRRSKYDYGWPELANLGEQEILSKEIFYDFAGSGSTANNSVFGYTPRYAEYKFRNDRIAGDFRTTLGFWHLGRFFLQRPLLNSDFLTMQENAPAFEESFRRIFAVVGAEANSDYLWMQLFHRLTAKRPLPYFGVPSIQ